MTEDGEWREVEGGEEEGGGTKRMVVVLQYSKDAVSLMPGDRVVVTHRFQVSFVQFNFKKLI